MSGPAPVARAFKVGATGLGIYAATLLVGALLEQNATGAAVAQAVLAEWGCGRLGITWSDPLAPAPSGKDIARRAGKGALLGLGAAAAAALVLLVTRSARVAEIGVSLTTLLLGLLLGGFAAMRDELLLHGLVLHVTSGVRSPYPRIAAAALASGAALVSAPMVTPAEILGATLFGGAFAAMWLLDRGAWLAWGAHAALLFGTRALFRGGLFELRSLHVSGAGLAAPFGGWAMAAVGGLVLVGSLVMIHRAGLWRGGTGAPACFP